MRWPWLPCLASSTTRSPDRIDVSLNGDGQFAVVRMVDASGSTGSNKRGRLVVIDLTGPTVVLDETSVSHGWPSDLGMAQGFDQVECTFDRVITAGEDLLSSPRIGWCQVLTLK